MDVEGLGENTARQLIDEGLIQDVGDLYFLCREPLLALEGFAEKKADGLMQAIAGSKERSLSRLLVGLGMRQVGGSVAQLLTSRYGSLDALAAATQDEIAEIEGVGPRIAQSVVRWFSQLGNRRIVAKLQRAGVRTTAEAVRENTESELEGLSFVITGRLSVPRAEVAALIEEHGGRVTSSVTRRTDFLVQGSGGGSSKQDRARQLGTRTITEEELSQMMDKAM
jgi:DNA ligase (NAD+)